MNEYLIKLKEWWQPLSQREKMYVSIASFAVLLFLLYQFLLSPYLDYIQSLRSKVDSNQALLSFMQASDEKIKRLEANESGGQESAPRSPAALISILKQSIGHAGFAKQLSQLKQANHETVQLQFQEIEFDKFITFLLQLNKNQGINVKQMTVVATAVPGIANIDLNIKS